MRLVATPEAAALNAHVVSFLGLEPQYREYESASYVVLPVPYDATTSYRPGARFGPAAILAASQQVETFDDELELEAFSAGIATLPPVEPNAAGPQAMHEDLYRTARRIVKDGKFLLALGGDHSITSAFVRAVQSRHKKLTVLQVDAHADLRSEYEQTPYSHAAVMRRVNDLGASIVSVGVRSYSVEEHRFLRRNSIEMITARECQSDDNWLDRALNALRGPVYVTIDIDAFDPAYAPGTGTPEPGGLDWYQVTGLLRLVAAETELVGADIVEVAPIPGQTTTEFLAARLAYKLIAYRQERR